MTSKMRGMFTSEATERNAAGQWIWALSFEADSGDIYTVGTYVTDAESAALKAAFVPEQATLASHDSQLASANFFNRDADDDSTGGVWH